MDSKENEPIATSGFWFTEELLPELEMKIQLKRITFDSKSKFQKIQIIETDPFGKTLVLDGKSQSALSDEYVYHESLVHPAMLLHPNPKRVYIGGGGEFATAREVLKHKTVEKCVMVDIDQVVCDVCRKEMPEWNEGVYEDSRMEVHYDDAYAYLKQTQEKFDVIIMDIADPIEAGPGNILYTQEFYLLALTKLSQDGVFVTQSGPGAPYNTTECFSSIHKTLSMAFSFVFPMTVDIPSFGSNWAFNIATKNISFASCEGTSFTEASSIQTNHLIQTRIKGNLKFYDGKSHLGLFGVSKRIRQLLEEEKRIITRETPIYMY